MTFIFRSFYIFLLLSLPIDLQPLVQIRQLLPVDGKRKCVEEADARLLGQLPIEYIRETVLL